MTDKAPITSMSKSISLTFSGDNRTMLSEVVNYIPDQGYVASQLVMDSEDCPLLCDSTNRIIAVVYSTEKEVTPLVLLFIMMQQAKLLVKKLAEQTMEALKDELLQEENEEDDETNYDG